MRISDWSSDVCSSDPGAPKCSNAPAPVADTARLHLDYTATSRGEAAEDFRLDRSRRPAPAGVHRPGAGAGRRTGDPRGAAATQRAGIRGQAARPRGAVEAGAVGHRRTLLGLRPRSEEHTSELQSLMRISYAVFCLKKKNNKTHT